MQKLTEQVLPWSAATDQATASAILEVVRTIASRLSSKDILAQAIEATQKQSAFPQSVHWVPYSLAQGYAGLSLLWAQMDACFPEEGWDLLGREHLSLAAHDLERPHQMPLGIFSGLSGVAFSAWELSRGGTRYGRLLQTLDRAIIARTLDLASRVSIANGCSVSDFDAISGLSGVASYLLCRRDNPDCVNCLYVVVEALVQLLNASEDPPRWHTPGKWIGDEQSLELYPHGWLNCGLAHGIPGPLALLSLAHVNGISVANLPQAVARTADWLCGHRLDDPWGINWPTAVPLRCDAATGRLSTGEVEAAPGGPSRSAWCYGSPGIARALWLAGEALGSQEYKDVAISALEAALRRPASERRIDSPTFCHGIAGLLQTTLRFANDLDSDHFRCAGNALLQQILARYSPDLLLGLRNLESGSNETDQPGFLDGVAGTAVVLLAAATNVAPTWDRLFLLS